MSPSPLARDAEAGAGGGVSVYAAGLVFQQAIGFATGALTARWLGPGGYGDLGVVRGLYGIALILAPIGLDLSLLRHLGERREDPGRALAQVSAFRAITGAVNLLALIAVGILLGPWLQAHVYRRPGFAIELGIGFCALPFAADMAVTGAALRTFGRVGAQARAALYLQPLLRAAALAAALAWGLGPAGVLGAAAVAAAAAAGAMSLDLARLGRAAGGRTGLAAGDGGTIARVYRYSGWMAFTMLAYGAMRSLDLLVLAHVRPAAEVGAYAAASTIAQLIALYPTALAQTLGPTVARLHAAGDRAALRDALHAYTRRATLLAAPLLAGVAAFGPWLDVVFGARFHISTPLSTSLALAYYVSGVLGPLSASLSMTGRHRQELAVLVLGALGALLACLALAPRFGGEAVAAAMAIGYLAVNGARVALSVPVIGGWDAQWRDLSAPLACLAAAFAWRAAADRMLPHDLAGAALAAAGLAAVDAALYALVLLDDGERAEARAMVARLRHAVGPVRRARAR